MNVTAVTVHLERHWTLRAYCEVELDGEFVLKQVKIVEKAGRFIVGMPSKHRTTPCIDGTCNTPCSIHYRYCPNCAADQGEQGPRIERLRQFHNLEPGAKVSFYADLFHPINQECRAKIERAVLEAYHRRRKEASDANSPE
jgi:DNA-binding cell septation regulator SpoVG